MKLRRMWPWAALCLCAWPGWGQENRALTVDEPAPMPLTAQEQPPGEEAAPPKAPPAKPAPPHRPSSAPT